MSQRRLLITLLCTLGAGTLVITAAADAGVLATLRQTHGGQRPLFAVPGSIRDPQARGCNQLIREGATLVQECGEILQGLRILSINQDLGVSRRPAAEARRAPVTLDNKYEMLLDAAGFEPVDIDVLALRTGWSGHAVASMLLVLELQGRVAPQPGGRYCRLS